MTEYELLDYTASLMANFQTTLALYFTIVTAYVVAAFIAGDRLTQLATDSGACTGWSGDDLSVLKESSADIATPKTLAALSSTPLLSL